MSQNQLKPMFDAVVLAAGQSSRMGRDKAGLVVNGQTLLERQINLARETGAQKIYISGRATGDYSTFGCPVLHDRFADAGPLAGIERALDACSQPLLLVLAVDMPHLTTSLVRELVAGTAQNIGVIPRLNGRIEPLAAFYPKTAHPLVAALLANGVSAATAFAERCVEQGLAAIVDLPPSRSVDFTNWNAPIDLTA